MDSAYLLRVLKYVLSTLLSIGLAAFFIYHISISVSSDIETMSITYTTKELALDYDGYIFRGESLLYTSTHSDGGINHLQEDGTKVAVGTPLCQIYDGSTAVGSNIEIQEIERKLKRLENSNINENLTYSDTSLIDDVIYNAYYTLLTRMASGNAGYAMAKSDELISALNQRQIITKRVENYDASIEALEIQYASYINNTGTITETVTADKSGYYYADIDGFEEIFSSDKVSNLTISDFAKLTSSNADLSLEYNAEGYSNCGKIVTDYNWYVACQITTEESREFYENYTYDIIFPYNSDTRINMILDRMVIEADDDRVILIFRTNTIPENFNFLRRQSIQIVVSTYEGYKVPVSAVRILDGVQGVYILEGYTVSFCRIEPLAEIDGYYICKENDGSTEMQEMLAMYDRIITNGKNLKVGKIIS